MAIWSSEIKELEKLYESLKGQLPELEKELGQLKKTEDANVIMLYSRRCLEVIITDLCECELNRPRKTEPLKGIIDKLHKEEKIPSHIITSMHGLNDLSTYGTHPKDFDPEQIKPLLINLDIIIKWYLKYKNIVAIGKIKGEEEKVVLRDVLLKGVRNEGRKEVQEKPDRLYNKKVLLNSIVIVVLLAIASTFLFLKIFKRDTLEKLRSSGEPIIVAVMPFQNMTNDTLLDIWQEGIQDNLFTSLSNNPEELEVRQIESITKILQSKGFTNYASITPSVASNISQKMDANVFIYGSINQSGSTIRLNAKLVDSKTENALKSFQIDGIAENILPLIDSLSMMVKNFLIIFKLGEEVGPDFEHEISTSSPEAYKYFIYGQKAFFKMDFPTACNWYFQAISIDTNFFYAIKMLALAYGNETKYALNLDAIDSSKKWCLKLYKKRDQMPIQLKIDINYLYAGLFETPYEEIKYCKQLLDFDDQNLYAYMNLGGAYFRLRQYDKAILENDKVFEIYKKWGVKPAWVADYTGLGFAYHKTGQFKKEKELYKKAEQDFPNDPRLALNQFSLSLTVGDTVAARRYFEIGTSYMKSESVSEAIISATLAFAYTEAGILYKAEEYYRRALSLEPENPAMMNSLAYFLIDNNRNINEGLELIDKALLLSPDVCEYLDTKGWGFYKQGKYQEALEILQKSWDLKPIYVHDFFLHLEAAKKAVANQKTN